MLNLASEIKGTESYVSLLNAVGVSTIHDLSQCQAAELSSVLEEMNGMIRAVGKNPDEAMVAEWIAKAQEADPLFNAHQDLKDRVSDIANIYTLDEWHKHLAQFQPPSKHDMHTTLNQIIMVIEQIYVHLSMKRARRAIDYILSLRLLRRHIDEGMNPLDFHAEMLKRLKSFGDIHTAYRLPPPYRHSVAFLPMLIQKCYSTYKGKRSTPRYYTTNTLWKPSPGLLLKPGDEIVSWNGVPMNEAVENHVAAVEGSNPSANLAFALQFMTTRWLGASFQPDSPWVIIGFKNRRGRKRELRIHWRVLELKQDPHFGTRAQFLWFLLNPSGQGQQLASDHALNATSQVQHFSSLLLYGEGKTRKFKSVSENKKMHTMVRKMHASGARHEQMKKLSLVEPGLQPEQWSKTFKGLKSRAVPTHLPMFLEAWILSNKPGNEGQFGHIRIRGFPMGGDARKDFIPELRRLLSLMPGDGLMMDVRGNPGGSANLAETALQLLCPKEIEPLHFQFIASPLTQQVANDGNVEFRKWGPSIDMALRTGGVFSSAFPITNPQTANEIGQEYFGPVVLTTDATSYSAADIFAAGFQDHHIGPLMGVDSTTGGGGANVLFYRQALGNDIPYKPLPGVPKEQLPAGIDLQFAYRRCVRTGDYRGIPVEEIGVETDAQYRHKLTSADLLKDDVDLRRHAIRLFSKLTKFDLKVTVKETASKVSVVVRSKNMDKLEFYIDDRLIRVHSIQKQSCEEFDTTSFSKKWTNEEGHRLQILGYQANADANPVARYKHILNT